MENAGEGRSSSASAFPQQSAKLSFKLRYDDVFTAFDLKDQIGSLDGFVLLWNWKPPWGFGQGLRLEMRPLPRENVDMFGVDAVHGDAGLAGGNVEHGISAVRL